MKLIDSPHLAGIRPAQFTELQKVDREYARNRAVRVEAVAGDDLRLYLPEKFPVLGRSASVEALRAKANAIVFGESKGDLSRAGDLGFLYGEYRGMLLPRRPAITCESGAGTSNGRGN